MFLVQLLVAGNETTRNMISGGMVALADRPASGNSCARDRSLVPTAVEEMLRWTTPVVSFMRTATRDAELGGQAIARGRPRAAALRVRQPGRAPVRTDGRRGSTSGATPTTTSRSASAPTSASARPSPASRARQLLEELLDRFGTVEPAGDVERSHSAVIAGMKRALFPSFDKEPRCCSTGSASPTRSPSSPAPAAASALRARSRFAEAGADVVIASRTKEQLEDVADQVSDRGRRALGVPCDVNETANLELLVDQAMSEFGRIDVVVNNAGGSMPRPVPRHEREGVRGRVPLQRHDRVHAEQAGPAAHARRRRREHREHLVGDGAADATGASSPTARRRARSRT